MLLEQALLEAVRKLNLQRPAKKKRAGLEEETAKLCCFWGEKQQRPVFLCLKLLEQQRGLRDLPKKTMEKGN